MICMQDKTKGLVPCQKILEHFLSVRRCTDDARSHHRPGAQLWVGSSRNWSILLRRPWHRMPRAGSDLLSMQPVDCTPPCYTDAKLGSLCL